MAEEADITVNKAEMRMGMQVGIPETLYAHSSPHRMALGCLPAGHADEVHEHQQRHVGTHSLLQQNWHQVGWAVPRLPQQSLSSKVQKGSMEYPVQYRNGSWECAIMVSSGQHHSMGRRPGWKLNLAMLSGT